MHSLIKEGDPPPLLVRNEGVLVKSDIVWESFYLLLKRNPLILLWLPFWLLRGKAFTTQQVIGRATPDVEYLPYNSQLITYLQEQRRIGRQLVLVTSLSEGYGRQISNHLGIFDSVLSRKELIGRAQIKKTKGEAADSDKLNFVYACRDEEDITLCENWPVLLVNPDPKNLDTLRNKYTIEQILVSESEDWFKYAQVIRAHQWLKNLLVFVPLVTAHQISDSMLVLRAIIAFAAFSLCASGIYILNDLLDIPADRRHPTKCNRPFAKATVPIRTGTMLILVLVFSAFGFGLILGTPFLYVLAGYLLTTTFYSCWLKKIALIDIVTLAFLYTTRIFAGGAAVSIMPSFWLLSFSMFIFFSLALMKRSTDLKQADTHGRKGLDGRGYTIDDSAFVHVFGISSGYLSVLVLALYINSENVRILYTHPRMIWLLCPVLLYWISRVWLLTGRGQMHDDPILFAIYDRVSQGLAVLGMFILWLAT